MSIKQNISRILQLSLLLFVVSCEEESTAPVEGIQLSESTMTMCKNEEKVLTATVLPKNASNKNVLWSSSDNTILTVNAGKLSAIKRGSVTVTATTEESNFTATCQVKVITKVIEEQLYGKWNATDGFYYTFNSDHTGSSGDRDDSLPLTWALHEDELEIKFSGGVGKSAYLSFIITDIADNRFEAYDRDDYEEETIIFTKR